MSMSKKRKYAASMISPTTMPKNREHAASILQSRARKKIDTLQKWVQAHQTQVMHASQKRWNNMNSLINRYMFGWNDKNLYNMINKLILSHGSAKNGAGYVYRSLLFSPNRVVSITKGTSIPHRNPSSWTLNPMMAVGWHDPRNLTKHVVILRMKTASNVRKLFVGSYRPPIDMRSPNLNPTMTDFANQAEVIVAKTNFIVTRVQTVPIGMLTGLNSTGKNHKHLPNTCGGSLVRNTPGLKIPGYTPNVSCTNNRPMPSILLVDVYPTPFEGP